MARWIAIIGVCCVLGAASASTAFAGQDDTIDVRKLPVSPDRLQRKVRESVEREQRDGITLRYSVDVFAKAPKNPIFSPSDNLRFGQVRYAVPTHQDMMNLVTPQEFRAPIMDFSEALRWLQRTAKKKKSD